MSINIHTATLPAARPVVERFLVRQNFVEIPRTGKVGGRECGGRSQESG